MYSKLPKIETSTEFEQAFSPLDPEMRAAAFAKIQADLPKIIQGGKSLGTVLKMLFPEQYDNVFGVIEANLPAIIGNSNDFADMLEPLSSEQRTVVLKKMKARLPELIKDGKSLGIVLKVLSPEQYAGVFRVIEASLPKILGEANDFTNMLELLTSEQRTDVLEKMKAHLPKIVNSGNWGDVLKWFGPEQYADIFAAIKGKLRSIINDVHLFGKMLAVLSPEQCTAVLENLYAWVNPINHCTELKRVISSVVDFRDMLKPLSPEQCKVISAAIIDMEVDISQARHLSTVFQGLSTEQCAAVYDGLKDKLSLPKIITDFYHLDDVLKYLPPAQCLDVCARVKESMPQIIKTVHDLKSILRNPEFEQRMAVFEGLQERLSQVITLDELLQYAPDNSQKGRIQKLFFTSLLQEAKMKSLDFNGDDKAKEAVDIIYGIRRCFTSLFQKSHTKKL